MPRPTKSKPELGDARKRLIEAARALILRVGYAATTVEDVCAAADVTKGAFFHHFKTKETLGVAVAEDWTACTASLFAAAAYHSVTDPCDRVLAYVALRKALIQGTLPELTCLAGTLVQEIYQSSPAMRAACAESILGHCGTLAPDMLAALRRCGLEHTHSAASLARHTQAVIQGAFIMAKAANDPEVARESIDHLEHYLRLLLSRPTIEGEST
ncbi:MAG TPA: TetR/AcrR family transcriptional regulator [Polyangiales bacterium]|nr:TetR/AcrR family transcriptional regulator [Polyangiales bacterium]